MKSKTRTDEYNICTTFSAQQYIHPAHAQYTFTLLCNRYQLHNTIDTFRSTTAHIIPLTVLHQ